MRAREHGALRVHSGDPLRRRREREVRVLRRGNVLVRRLRVHVLRDRRVRRVVRMPDVDAGGGAVPLLVENHARFLDFLERRVGSREVAEDILQDAYVRGIDKASSLRDLESATAWFYRLLRNAITDHYRRRGAEERAFARVAADSEAESDAGGAPADAELFRAVCECVVSLLDTIKPEFARALQRVEIDEASVRELAAEEGITPNNAAVRLHRARAALRKQLTACCGTCATHGCVDCHCSSAHREGAARDVSGNETPPARRRSRSAP